jgi:xylulokinase
VLEETYYLAVDIGTSGCKAIAIDTNARQVAQDTREYPIYSPEPGWTQQDPADWWAGAQQALRTVCAQIDPKKIGAVGVTGQMHGMVCLGAAHDVLTPAILWNDQRTAAQTERIHTRAGGAAGSVAATNNACLTGFTVGKVLWLKENKPAAYKKIRTVFNPKDYIRFLLTGAIATDVSDASGTGYFDVQNGVWATDYLHTIGLGEMIPALPPVLESVAFAGQITAAIAAQTGIPAGTPVVAGGGDAVLSSVSMGLAGDDRIAVTIGTSGVVARHVTQFDANTGGKLQFSRACLAGKFHKMGVTLSAAGSESWYAQRFGDAHLPSNAARYKALDTEAAESAPGANGVLFLPYLRGERCPLNDPAAKGAFLGLTADRTKADFTRAVLEGVVFSLKHVYQTLGSGDGGELVLAGGGAASPLWRQIAADIFALPVATLEAGEAGSSYGAAILAGLAHGAWKNAAEILSKLPVKARCQPRAETAAVYAKAYQKYLAASAALRGIS